MKNKIQFSSLSKELQAKIKKELADVSHSPEAVKFSRLYHLTKDDIRANHKSSLPGRLIMLQAFIDEWLEKIQNEISSEGLN